MLDLLFFLISRLKNACTPLVINLQIYLPIGIKDIPFKSSQLSYNSENRNKILGIQIDPSWNDGNV